MEVEAACRAVNIHDFSSEIEAWHESGFHGLWIYFVQRDAADGYDCLLQGSDALEGKSEGFDCGDLLFGAAEPFQQLRERRGEFRRDGKARKIAVPCDCGGLLNGHGRRKVDCDTRDVAGGA